MKEMFNELIQYRHLLFMLTWKDIKIKYKQSVMGFLWAIFMPMIIVAAGILVKKAFSMLSGKPMDLASIVHHVPAEAEGVNQRVGRKIAERLVQIL